MSTILCVYERDARVSLTFKYLIYRRIFVALVNKDYADSLMNQSVGG